jgi:hypothetical protein
MVIMCVQNVVLRHMATAAMLRRVISSVTAARRPTLSADNDGVPFVVRAKGPAFGVGEQ